MYSDRSESKVVKSRSVFLPEAYLNFDVAREALISGKMSWARTTPEMWREFLKILAADLAKNAKDLNSKDFSGEKSSSLGGKLLDGLIGHIERRFGLGNEEAIWFIKRESGIAHTGVLFFTGEKAARSGPEVTSTREEEWLRFSEKRVPWELTSPGFHRHLVARQALRLKKDPFDITLKDLAKSGFPEWERNLMTLVHHYAKQTEEFRAHLARELGLILKKDAALVTENELKGIGILDPIRTLVRLHRRCTHKENAVKAGFNLLMQTIGFSEAVGQQRFNFNRVELPKVQAQPKPVKPKTAFKLSDQISVKELQRRVKPTVSVIEARRYVDAKGQKRINFRVRTPVYKYPKGKLFDFGPTPRLRRIGKESVEKKLDAPGQQYLDFRVRKQVYPKGRLFRGIGRIANREERVEEHRQIAAYKDPRQRLLDFSSPKKIKPKDKRQRQIADTTAKLDAPQNISLPVSQPILRLPTKIFIRDAIKQILSEQSQPISLKKITRLLRRDPQFSTLSKSQVKRVIKADQELKADARIKRKVKQVEDLNAVDLILDQEIIRAQQKFGDRNLRRPGISAPLELADFEKLWARGAGLSSREKVFGSPMVYLSTLLLNPEFYKGKVVDAEFKGLFGKPLGLTDQFGRIHIPLLANEFFPVTVIQRPEAGWEVEVASIGIEEGFFNLITRSRKSPLEKGVHSLFVLSGRLPSRQQFIYSYDALSRLSGLSTIGKLFQNHLLKEFPKFIEQLSPLEQAITFRLLAGEFDKSIIAQGYSKEQLSQIQSKLLAEFTRMGRSYRTTVRSESTKLKRNEFFATAESYLQNEDTAGLIKMLFDQLSLNFDQYSDKARLRQIVGYELVPDKADLQKLIRFLSEEYASESPIRCNMSEITDLVSRAFPLKKAKPISDPSILPSISPRNENILETKFVVEKNLHRIDFDDLLDLSDDYHDIGIVFVARGLRIPAEEIGAAGRYLTRGTEVELIISGGESQRRAAIHTRILRIMRETKKVDDSPKLFVEGSIVTIIASELLAVGRNFKELPSSRPRCYAKLVRAQTELAEISHKIELNKDQIPLKTKFLFWKTIFNLQLQCCELLVAKKFDYEARDFIENILISGIKHAQAENSPHSAQQFEDFKKWLDRIVQKVNGTESEAIYKNITFQSLSGRKIDF